MMTKTEAQELVDSLRHNMLNAEKNLQKILDEQAWIPLGYESFPVFWNEELSDIKFAQAFTMQQICWCFFDAGMSAEQIQEAMGGKIGDAKVAHYENYYNLGVTKDELQHVPVNPPRAPKANEYAVSAHLRSKPRPPQKVHVELTAEEYDEWVAFAKKHNKSVSDFTHDSIKHCLALYRNGVDLENKELESV